MTHSPTQAREILAKALAGAGPMTHAAALSLLGELGDEEALYWLAKCQNPDSDRALRAMRLLVDTPERRLALASEEDSLGFPKPLGIKT